MYECDQCKEYGLRFRRSYAPEDFFEGKTDSRVWIVGLNPANDPDWQDPREVGQLRNCLDDPSKAHSYFRDFLSVSARLYDQLGKPGGVGHTDLVKCFSRHWPPHGTSPRDRREIISNCSHVLLEQLSKMRPSILVCNGAEVCVAIRQLVPSPAGTPRDATSYVADFAGRPLCVLLSGFIGRIDNYSRRRLGVEIESRMAQLGL